MIEASPVARISFPTRLPKTSVYYKTPFFAQTELGMNGSSGEDVTSAVEVLTMRSVVPKPVA